MNLQFNFFTLLFLLISLCFTSCEEDETLAKNSIKGNWNVVEITSIYAEFSDNGYNPIETISEEGQLGNFNFGEDSVRLNFTRNDSSFIGYSAWELTTKVVKAGFSNVNKFTLNIDQEFVFNLEFEDGTLNSEKGAREMTFINNPSNGNGVLIKMVLEKI